jgi:Family of unknown function (DUF5309)
MATGTRTTYTETSVIKRAIADTIAMIDWTEAPLLNKLGLDNASKFRLVNWPNTKVEWIEDTMSPRQGTINEALDTSETGIDLQTGEGDYLKTGDILRIDDELFYVSSVATDVATVVRGFAGTTAATHNSGAVWRKATIARLEGADFTTGHTTTVSVPYNYTQILSEAIRVTGSEKVNPKYGIPDTMAYHLMKLIGGGPVGQKQKAGALPILLEQSFYHGRRAIGTASTARAMGGFNQYVTTNVTNLASAALTRTHIEDKMQACYEAGGSPDTIICGAWARRKISSFYEGVIRTERSETRGGSSITTIVTDFGELEIMYDKWCPTNELYIIEPSKMGWLTFRGFDVYDRASTGDYEVKDVLGEFTFALVNEQAHARLYGFSTTS